MTSRPPSDITAGLLAALAAFIAWGLLPVYWKAVQDVAPLEILCHRILWSLVFIAAILSCKHRWAETFAPLRSPRNLLILSLSSLTIACNWLIYIWAVNNGNVLATSLGYYINPLVNVLFGFLFFRERLNPLQTTAIGLAALGVANSVIGYGEFPWISLTLAVTFACYGLLRKIAAVESLPGLFLETMVLAPAALLYVLHLQAAGRSGFLAGNSHIDLLLIGAGAATALPLIGFAFGARRLRLTTVGLLQYIAPSIAFSLGIFVYNEPFGPTHLLTFALIWSGLALYTIDSIRAIRRHRRTRTMVDRTPEATTTVPTDPAPKGREP
ncbi:EamA family transporter RarD [Pseudodesulfovibrio sp. F-1]|uniref:EamA family transporter RarD n=1 Tax=Pseudodesulfovibrio alkaliphilus TaxID=2661613 RepID=A0A7K1KK10_9BACT|nr:EamA family transporter RarD [Pseudodesulfovibrio alkaliphilus]MUM76407.1 EamA family transporter RarD [Pseudodesulfovibrio alkaliphilus]